MNDLDRDALDRWITNNPNDRNYGPCYCGLDINAHDPNGCDFCDCRGYEEDTGEDDYFESDDYGDEEFEDDYYDEGY